jgi:hypothetical protein
VCVVSLVRTHTQNRSSVSLVRASKFELLPFYRVGLEGPIITFDHLSLFCVHDKSEYLPAHQLQSLQLVVNCLPLLVRASRGSGIF